MYLDLPSVARPASDSGLGKVSGWMIWISRECLSAFRVQVYLDLSSVADCVFWAPSGARWRGWAAFWSGNNTPTTEGGRRAPATVLGRQQFPGRDTRPPRGSLAPRKWLPARCGASRQSSQDLHEAQLVPNALRPGPSGPAGVVAVPPTCALHTELCGCPRNSILGFPAGQMVRPF